MAAGVDRAVAHVRSHTVPLAYRTNASCARASEPSAAHARGLSAHGNLSTLTRRAVLSHHQTGFKEQRHGIALTLKKERFLVKNISISRMFKKQCRANGTAQRCFARAAGCALRLGPCAEYLGGNETVPCALAVVASTNNRAVSAWALWSLPLVSSLTPLLSFLVEYAPLRAPPVPPVLPPDVQANQTPRREN